VLKRLIFWEFPRTTWRYDLVVGLILAFIFLTPRTVFHDEPRAPGVVRLPEQNGAAVFFVEAGLLKQTTPEALVPEAEALVSKRLRQAAPVSRVLAIQSEGERPAGFMVYLKP
jgi:hypothetical protein